MCDFFAVQHELAAILLDLHLRFSMNLVLRYLVISCISTGTWCYAAWPSLAFCFELDATLLDLLLHFNMNFMLRYLVFFRVSTWAWRRAAWSSLAFQQELDATLVDFHFHFNIWYYATWSSFVFNAFSMNLMLHCFNMNLMLLENWKESNSWEMRFFKFCGQIACWAGTWLQASKKSNFRDIFICIRRSA